MDLVLCNILAIFLALAFYGMHVKETNYVACFFCIITIVGMLIVDYNSFKSYTMTTKEKRIEDEKEKERIRRYIESDNFENFHREMYEYNRRRFDDGDGPYRAR